ncbi:hypothetical protein PsorP6_012225 [Peronosclerospora sorghi]|uniref:Uncharacterized protein n=1 Tax=Peronosclerospora sorghi TaxID=230839 RepID=A0ACC0WJJ7_9STRA|nr:hypothetical protein PsorP6_012225 [Peronosclerospora sorghi]
MLTQMNTCMEVALVFKRKRILVRQSPGGLIRQLDGINSFDVTKDVTTTANAGHVLCALRKRCGTENP